MTKTAKTPKADVAAIPTPAGRGRSRLIHQTKDLMATLKAYRDGKVVLTNHVLTQLTIYGFLNKVKVEGGGRGKRFEYSLTRKGTALANRAEKAASAELKALVKAGARTLAHHYVQEKKAA